MDTRVTCTVIEIDFTINTRRAGLAVALVAVHQVDAAALVQAGAAVTLVYLVAADGAHVPRVADAGVGINPILTLAVVAGIGVTVVDVLLTQHTSESCGALAFIAVRVIDALGPVQTRSAGTVININLANWPGEARWTQTLEAIDFIHTLPVVHTGVALTFVYLQLTMHTFETWHAQACEAPDLIQTGGIVLAGVGMALVDIHLTARPRVALQTLAVEGAVCVHTFPCVLTRIAIGHGALIHVFCAVSPFVALWAGADILPVQGVGITQCPLVARIADACIIQMTQESCLSLWAHAREGGHTVNAGGAWRAGGEGAVVDVLAAVVSTPAIDAHAAVPSIAVGTGASVLTGVGLQQALVHILRAELSCPLRGAAAVVGIDPIHTNPSVLTPVVRAVINIPLTGAAFKTWKAVALKSEVAGLPAGASIDTGRGCTWHVGAVAVLPGEALGALALIGAREVEAGATMLALSWNVTLVDVSLTFLPCEAWQAFAGELVGHGGTGTSICTGMRQAGIRPLAQLTCKANLAGALIIILAEHVAGASIQTGRRCIAGVSG